MQPNPVTAQPTVLTGSQNRVLRNTYWLLGLSLIPTALGALIGVNLNVLGFVRANPILFSLAAIAIFYGWIYAIERNRDSALGLGLMLGFTFLMGLLLGPVLQMALGLKNGGQLVTLAAGGTAATFFALAMVATTTRRSFSGLSSFLAVGVIVVMLAVVANIFLASPLLHLVVCGAFVLLSSLLILYHLNGVVQGGETNYISATLSVYIAVYNLFSSLLQILMTVMGERD
ncbi:MAG TPA: Bax inhibitor-1/YccA family protein [Steroidobacteraceae bacterium]|nr:Bax inhibitor-1/YccA family protein [Steroidobacteraceae bacterium]